KAGNNIERARGILFVRTPRARGVRLERAFSSVERVYCLCPCVVTVFCCAFFRASNAAWYSSWVMSYQLIQANPISSTLRLPEPTQFLGSGLPLLAGELSCHEITWRIVPAG